ncbi:unnamed protein product [Somion occarium]|uniref:Uncharacterized protein n=1 Tax=Somion occarium TaxID=3059160 RepID=A0ABP1DJR1_9APHY
MLLNSGGPSATSRRPSLHTRVPSLTPEFSDSRTHGPTGPSRHVRLPRATTYGGGSIAKSEDGTRCVVAGKESLRILRVTEPDATASTSAEHRTAVGRGGYRIEASRNLWGGSGFKIDSAFTDVAWGHGPFSNKILTSARNGELIMWDLQKTGASKYERRARDHVRSIQQLACSTISMNYCLTGSADGDLRIWDMRDLSKSIMRIRHPTSVRSLVLSPLSWQPLQAITGLDNGSIYRWDLNMGQRGLLDRIPVAHSKAIIALDWSHPHSTFGVKNAPVSPTQASSPWYGGMGAGLFDDIGGFGGVGSGTSGLTNTPVVADGETSRMGWLASGGLDRCVKVWDLTAPSPETHISRTPAYTLHTSFPVRRVLWRPGPAYECELAVVSNVEFSTGSGTVDQASPPGALSPNMSSEALPSEGTETALSVAETKASLATMKSEVGDPVEIWDVRRGHIAKWVVRGSAVDGGVTDMVFGDPHSIWAQHFSGSFSQFDLRQMLKPLDAVPRVAATWDVSGSLVFVADRPRRWEVPYDDIPPEKRQLVQEQKGKLKALGDKPYGPKTQTVGMLAGTDLTEDIDVFVKLAKGYIFEGTDRREICTHNAEVASGAGKQDAAQAWLLLHSLLIDLNLPPSPTLSLSPLPLVPPQLPHSNSAPAAVPTTGHRIASTSVSVLPPRSISLDDQAHGRRSSASPSSSRHSPEKPSAPSSVTGYLTPQRVTPASSVHSSPHHASSALPSVPGARRPSNSGLSALTPISSGPQKRPKMFPSYGRRPSFLHSAQSASPSDMSVKSGPLSLKHVGEGALSDSDEEDEDEEEKGSGRGSDAESEDEHPELQESFHSDRGSIHTEISTSFRPSISPYLYPRTSGATSHTHIHPNPSPLSRVAGQQTWTEDEDDRDGEDSPSPASSSNSDYENSDGEGSDAAFKVSKGKISRRSSKSSRHRTRSRSSTVASLAASQPTLKPTSALTVQTPKLTKQDSQSSIRTVTAVNSPYTDDMKDPSSLYRDDTVRDLASSFSFGRPGSVQPTSYLQHKRVRSTISAEFTLGGARSSRGTSVERVSNAIPKKRAASVTKEQVEEVEERVRDVGWEALRESLDVFADEGDVQMCTLLSLVAGAELKVTRTRLVRFLESYIDLLVRLRLHTAAAYMRKFTPAEEVRNATLLETTIYTACGRCRKPLMLPSGGTVLSTTPTNATTPHHQVKLSLEPKPPPKPAGNYAFCLQCKQSSSRCSICHLPVRAMLFKCTVCMHGGHQECYQMYYLRRPMIEIKPHQPPVPQPLPAPPRPPTPSLVHQGKPPTRGRALSRVADDVSDDGVSAIVKDGNSDGGGPAGVGGGVRGSMAVLGHPCAAGCGHYCWAASDALYSQPLE